MAKSIKDMALEYGHKHMGCCDIEDFEAGANAVLSEIEEAIKHTEPGGSPYVAVLDRIKQLKEEDRA